MNFSSIGVHVSMQEHPANFFLYRTRHPNSIQLVLCVVEEVWSIVTSTENVKEWKGKA